MKGSEDNEKESIVHINGKGEIFVETVSVPVNLELCHPGTAGKDISL